MGLVRDVGRLGCVLNAQSVPLSPAGEHPSLHVQGTAKAHERVQQPGAGGMEHATGRQGCTITRSSGLDWRKKVIWEMQFEC